MKTKTEQQLLSTVTVTPHKKWYLDTKGWRRGKGGSVSRGGQLGPESSAPSKLSPLGAGANSPSVGLGLSGGSPRGLGGRSRLRAGCSQLGAGALSTFQSVRSDREGPSFHGLSPSCYPRLAPCLLSRPFQFTQQTGCYLEEDSVHLGCLLMFSCARALMTLQGRVPGLREAKALAREP